MRTSMRVFSGLVLGCAFAGACGDDDDGGYGTEADRFGVGAECDSDADCFRERGDGGIVQECLTEFRAGYCGVRDCRFDEDCPFGSACVAHDNGTNYCFRTCRDKSECNLNRSPGAESNCSSNVDFVGEPRGAKTCVPPSSG